MSCTDANPQRPTPVDHSSLSARAARQAADHEALESEQARQEVSRQAGSLAHDAHYATRAPLAGVILLPAPTYGLSPRAALLAHGIWYARVKVQLYRATHAYVCLDCSWVGAFSDEGIDQQRERDAHTCGGMVPR